MSAQELLTSRAIIGEFFRRLSVANDTWSRKVGMYFPSFQETEKYPWLGQVPGMREWVGGRHAKGFWDNKLEVTNIPYESTMKVRVPDLRRDKTGQMMIRISEQVRRADTHWMSLLSTLILAGTSTACYDGEYFFDTDHAEGNNSTNQDNALSIDISGLPVAEEYQGSTTAPGSLVMMHVILRMITAILGFKDNENEPMNENAKSFLVMTPLSLYPAALSAVSNMVLSGGEMNTLKSGQLNVEVIPNARLTWTTSLACFRTDGDVKPFILQEEKPISVSAIAEGSELEFHNNEHHYGIDASRAVAYGYWQEACYANMI